MDVEARRQSIEQMVFRLREALMGGNSQIDAADGMSAAMTFTSIMAKILVARTQNPQDKLVNASNISTKLREIADEVEFEACAGKMH